MQIFKRNIPDKEFLFVTYFNLLYSNFVASFDYFIIFHEFWNFFRQYLGFVPLIATFEQKLKCTLSLFIETVIALFRTNVNFI